jgi:ribosomal protein S18 acetylase RimI-like enzyme
MGEVDHEPDARILVAREVSGDLVDAFARLIPQLTSEPPPSADALRAVIDDPATTVLLSVVDDRIVGTLTLAVFRQPTSVHARIEDLLVDEGQRGRRIGESLVREGLRIAKYRGATEVALTSAPEREAAKNPISGSGSSATPRTSTGSTCSERDHRRRQKPSSNS